MLAPRYVEENILIVLRVPCTVETALAELHDARIDEDVLRCGNVIVPAVQPSNSFAVVLALPDWTADWLGQQTCVLIDARALDGRLFAWIVPTYTSRQVMLSLCQVRSSTGLRIAVNGVLQVAHMLGPLAAGDVITIVPSDAAWPAPAVLEDMLLGPRNWQPCTLFPGPLDSAFQVLSDRQDITVAIDFDSLQSSDDFRSFAAAILGFDPASTTVCPTIPRIQNLLQCGQKCQAVIAITTRISRIPIPPGRLLPRQHVIFLDCRPILQEVTWLLAREGHVNLQTLREQYAVDAPEGYSVIIVH